MFKKPVSFALVTLVTILLVAVPTVYAQPGYTNAKIVTLNLSATDNGSGMGAGAEMRFSNDGQSWSVAEAFAAAKQNWDITAYGGGTADGTKTVYAKFKDIAGNWSVTQITASIILDTTLPVTTASPAGGNYNQSQAITLSSNEAATIYYTTDGSAPTTGSAVYTSPINISSSTTLKFFAVDNAENAEAVKTEAYNIDTQGPVTTASPAGGLYNAAQPVTLTADKPATIYYTTDGSAPTTGSAVYTSPINISSSTTLKFFGVDDYANAENIKTEAYTIDTSAPTVAVTSPAAGFLTNLASITVTGTVDDDTATVSVNGVSATISAGTFTATGVTLTEGVNTITATATDPAGNQGTGSINGTLDTIPPTGIIAIIQ